MTIDDGTKCDISLFVYFAHVDITIDLTVLRRHLRNIMAVVALCKS